MRLSDNLGNPMTASAPAPVELLDRAVTAYLGFRADTGDRLKEALAADPDLALGHCLRGYFMMLFGQRAMVPRAERSLAAAREAVEAAGATPRERAHLGALATWIAGDFAGATACWDAIAGEHPRDMLALKLAQYGYFYAGESERMLGVLVRALPAWDQGLPGYGFLLGCHAFALEEIGDYRAAEHAGRDAIERNPADIWAAHAVAHVFEMAGRPRDGLRWIEGLEDNWLRCNNFACHLFWHRCLFLLELGMQARVLDLYDREVRPDSTDDLLDISNAVSLLWRLEQQGVGVGSRWHELADRARAHVDDHLLVFGDLHYLMALAAAGYTKDAARMVDSLSRFAAESSESQAVVAREPALALARALLAHRRGGHESVVSELSPVRGAVQRIGGSHAQRDLFEQMLVDSAVRAGNPGLALKLIASRLEDRPRNVWGWNQRAIAFEQLGDSDAAAAARTRAAQLAAST
jgi:tetratricopeptide (TPR) repeat protein